MSSIYTIHIAVLLHTCTSSIVVGTRHRFCDRRCGRKNIAETCPQNSVLTSLTIENVPTVRFLPGHTYQLPSCGGQHAGCVMDIEGQKTLRRHRNVPHGSVPIFQTTEDVTTTWSLPGNIYIHVPRWSGNIRCKSGICPKSNSTHPYYDSENQRPSPETSHSQAGRVIKLVLNINHGDVFV